MSDFTHMKSKVKVVTCFSYKKRRQCSYGGLVEMLMKTENTCRIFGFLNVKCVMERFTYFMESTMCVSAVRLEHINVKKMQLLFRGEVNSNS